LTLAIRDKVKYLKITGTPIVQIDEPAIREGLPLHHADWNVFFQVQVLLIQLEHTYVLF
jgi:5-methyltetrahydropteroyltriglutamate--homocysteine methyltransferase